MELSCGSGSGCPFDFRVLVSGSTTGSVSESFRFVDVDGDVDSAVVLVGIDSIIYKLALFFVALVISLH